MLALSTAFMSDSFSDPKDFFKFALQVGFYGFEIGISKVKFSEEDFINWQNKLGLKIVSVHNIFTPLEIKQQRKYNLRSPNPVRNKTPKVSALPSAKISNGAKGDLSLTGFNGTTLLPNDSRGDSLSSLDEKKRCKTIELTLHTAKVAKKLGAKAVILHIGSIEEKSFREEVGAFKDSWAKEKGRRQYALWRNKLKKIRKKVSKDYFENALRSVKSLCQMEPDILFCIETRVNFFELPDFDEATQIFKKIKLPNLCYWHDTGHSQIRENLGFATQKIWLKAFKDKMAGIHLHDTKSLEDHLPPGKGEIVFDLIKKYIKKQTIKVIEIDKTFSKNELIESFRFLKSKGLA